MNTTKTVILLAIPVLFVIGAMIYLQAPPWGAFIGLLLYLHIITIDRGITRLIKLMEKDDD